MSWRENLREASFRGVPFKVSSHDSETSGRRVHLHEYPGRDRPYPEDLGLKTREFTMQAYVLGADYMAARDQVIDACAKAGSGLLMHPYLGQHTVICTGCKVAERVEEGGVARLTLTFVDSGENKFPSAAADTAKTVSLRATDALTAAETGFAQRFNVNGFPAFVPDDAGAAAAKAVAAIQTVAGKRVSGAFAAAARDITANAGTLIRTPPTFASQLTGLTRLAVDETGGGRAGVSALSPLTNFGAALPAVATTTATRIRQAQNQTALIDLVRRSAIIETARLAPAIDFSYSQEALSLRDQVGDLLDREMEGSSTVEEDLAFTALGALRAAVVKDLNGRAPTLASLIETVAAATEPSLVTAYRLYGDASRADEVAARNRLRHPGFVPGGERLEVLGNV